MSDSNNIALNISLSIIVFGAIIGCVTFAAISARKHKPEEKEDYAPNVSRVRHAGHAYLAFRDFNGSSSVVHDPDCSCTK
jgi:hypothetical protein